jgi:hypothetical protein
MTKEGGKKEKGREGTTRRMDRLSAKEFLEK